MASIKTKNFLPEVFRTTTNKKFLNATLDQLFSTPDLRAINAYVGRKFAPTYKSSDNYQPEPTANRQNYQLEPSVVVKNQSGNIDFFSSYIDLINSVDHAGGLVNNHSRLFESETYSYDGMFDYDKFVNFNQYYWLENGPMPVNVVGGTASTESVFNITRNKTTGNYTIDGYGSVGNPSLNLSYGSTYYFKVDQPGFPFWIQTQEGMTGTNFTQPTTSTREVAGVENNGIDVGVIKFTVPQSGAQDRFINMQMAGVADYATDMAYNDLHGKTLSSILDNGGLDGVISDLNNKTVIFVEQDMTDSSRWTVGSQTIPITNRFYIWSIIVDKTGIEPVVRLQPQTSIQPNEKVYVTSGVVYAEQSYYFTNSYDTYIKIPTITAPLTTLFYQDGVTGSMVGQINVSTAESLTIRVDDDIVGKPQYISPNGVAFTNGMIVKFDSSVVPESYRNNTYYVEGVGESIQLILTDYMVTPEAFADNGNNTPDYITINRGSIDLNAWSRSNRWVHSDVIKVSAEYNNLVPLYDQSKRATRPIIEFIPSMHLMDFGSVGVKPIDLLNFSVVDAFNEIELSTNFTLDGVPMFDGMRVIFANDFDPTVSNKIYVIRIEAVLGQNVVTLTLADDGNIDKNETVVVKSGPYKGISYFFDGTEWVNGQQKTKVNQEPLFDIFDANGNSFGDTLVYPTTTFVGSKIFSYAKGTGKNDTTLGFPLSYRNFDQFGDIQFENNFDIDTFVNEGETISVNSGVIHVNTGLTTFNVRNVWTTNVEHSKQYQIFNYRYDGNSPFFQIDINADATVSVPNIRAFVNSKEVAATNLELATSGVYTFVKINQTMAEGDNVDVLVYSSTEVSEIGYYEIPKTLNNNSKNEQFTSLTLGQLRNHLLTMVSNSTKVNGTVPGDSNIRDIPIKQQGGVIVQHASPALYSGLFLVDENANFVDAINRAKHEYGKIKNKILELSSNLGEIDYTDIPAMLDQILMKINVVKNKTFPWYYSDMLAYGNDFTEIVHTVYRTDIVDYEISNIFDDNALSDKAVYVYLNNRLLVKGTEYRFDTQRSGVTILAPLSQGDTITVREYTSTDGCYIPETPSKLGIYPKFVPMIYFDDTYVTPTNVIQGHDGSLTIAFGDYRDQLLLEFETRIYNNIKVGYGSNGFKIHDFIPGKFRKVDYNIDEYTQIVSKSFLNWVGSYKINYTDNDTFVASNPFTWNYRKFKDNIDGEALTGTWRAIYKYLYDTDRPHLAPWEMLGFSEQPSWWEKRYGPAPYTGGNLVLWSDLEEGLIFDGERAGYDAKYARPGLLNIIPVDDHGSLRSPDQFVVAEYNSNDASASFVIGNYGPVENAWARSSDYPYAVQLAMALSKPGFYFGTLMNVEQYNDNNILNQYSVANTLRRVTPESVLLNGDSNGALRAAGYLNWIQDHITALGMNANSYLKNYLDNVSVQLAYKMAGYSDKSMIEVLAEQSSPTSTSHGIVVPNENYELKLNKSTPVATIEYSAVMVEESNGAYVVSGFNTTNPYFTIIPSIQNNNAFSITVLNETGTIFNDYESYMVQVPYGFSFSTKQQVVDFLVSYQRYLTSVGIVFDTFDQNLGAQRDFILSSREFLIWSQQGWGEGNVIVLSPVLDTINVQTGQGVIDEVANNPLKSRILDVNSNFIKSNQFTVTREDNTFSIATTSNQTIGLAVLDVVEYEHVMIFDNETVFNDVIYVPSLGNRQFRLKLVGKKTGSWTGAFNPQGFVYNKPEFDEWKSNTDYKLGSLVMFKGFYYTALNDIDAAVNFDPSLWKQIPASQIQTGLLPNFSYNAEKFKRIYDVDNPETLGDFAKYTSSLIGFRERDYLTDFGIDLPTQVKFYQGFIKDKGTMNAVKALTAAGFNGVSSTINVYDEWALRVGEYGALENNKYVELILPEDKFTTDPIAFTLLPNGGVTTDNITAIYPQDIYKVSHEYSTTPFVNQDEKSNYLTDIRTAGYVRMGDASQTLFNIDNIESMNAHLGNVAIGYTIWTAIDSKNDWNIYRVNETLNNVERFSYNIDNIGIVKTENAHGLVVNDIIVIKGFDNVVDGFYRVYSIIDGQSFGVIIPDANVTEIRRLGSVSGIGAMFKLQSQRISGNTDISSIDPIQGWIDGDKLWVDYNYSTNGWAVYNKTTPWQENDSQLEIANYVSDSGLGSCVAISSNGILAAASQPKLAEGVVSVFTANIAAGNVYELTSNVVCSRNHGNASMFGTSLAITANPYRLFVGAPSSGSFAGNVDVYSISGNAANISQTIGGFAAGDSFGKSMAVSTDAEWLFVSAPATGNVYVYHNSNVGYALHTTISGNAGEGFGYAVKTTKDGRQLAVSSPSATVNGITAAGAVYVYNRSVEAFTSDGVSATFTTQFATQAFSKVFVNGIMQTSGYTFPTSNTVQFSAPLEIGTKIEVETNNFSLMETLTSDNPTAGDLFGYAIEFSANDAEIFVSSPNYTETGYFSGIVTRFVNQGSRYGSITGNAYDPVVTVGHGIRVNGVLVTFTGNTVANVSVDINNAGISGVSSTISDYGSLVITSNSKAELNKLTIGNGIGTALTDLGLEVFNGVQVFKHSEQESIGQFGTSIVSSVDSNTVVIGASRGSTENISVFDGGATSFDAGSTTFKDIETGSGLVYVYGLVNAALSGNAKDQYAVVQKLQNKNLSTNDQFGTSMCMANGILLVGTPGDSNHTTFNQESELMEFIPNGGTIYRYDNVSGKIGWDILRAEEPKVDVDRLTRMYLYDNKKEELITNFDFFDPAKGKILGAAEQNLDFITEYDPAIYNVVAVDGIAESESFHWNDSQVGKTWWNLSKVRYIDYEQGDLGYRMSMWGKLFPESSVEVYEWVESSVVPSQYTGDGTPVYANDSAYVVANYVDKTANLVKQKYYFWVKDKISLDTNTSLHTTSIVNTQSMIENPESQGIPYVSVMRNDTVMAVGITNVLNDNNVVMHIDYDTLKNNNIIHSEYQLVQEGNGSSKIPDRIVEKLIDSLSGVDANGNLVPDPSLSFQTKIGIGVKPNQTIFEDQRLALKNYIEYVNNVFVDNPMVEEFNIAQLYDEEPYPAVDQYDTTASSRAEMGYINTSGISAGCTVLVINDETNNNQWAMYQFNGTNFVLMTRDGQPYVQSYNTQLYWKKIDWVDSMFDMTTSPNYIVQNIADVQTLTIAAGDVVKILNNGQGQTLVYRYTSETNYDIVYIQNGTIELLDSIYKNAVIPSKEIRVIFDTIQNHLFINTLADKFNEMFFFMVNCILAEQKSVDWMVKTSFISVLHKLRKLEQIPSFIPDNQTYYENYINEVKPYRTTLREYLLDYQGNDIYEGNLTDFDIPSTYSDINKKYRSPDGSLSTDAYELANTAIYEPWYNNHSYSIASVVVEDAGTGYYLPPLVSVVGGNGSGAVITAEIDTVTTGIKSFTVVKAGSGYTSTPSIVINGTGTGAKAYPLLNNVFFNDNIQVTELNIEENITASKGNLLVQPISGAYGTVYESVVNSKSVKLVDVNGVFTTNQYLYLDGANISVRPGDLNETLTFVSNIPPTVFGNVLIQPSVIEFTAPITSVVGQYVTQTTNTSNVQVMANSTGYYITVGDNGMFDTVGNILLNGVDTNMVPIMITDYVAGDVANVLSANTVTLTNMTGKFNTVANVFLQTSIYGNVVVSDLGMSPAGITSVTINPVFTEYIALENKSYNTVRTFDSVLKFDRISYTSNIVDWAANTVIAANTIVSYNGKGYRALSTINPETTIRLTGNITANIGDYVTQANATGNATIANFVSNSVITVNSMTGMFNGRGGNLFVNGVNANVIPISTQAIFEYDQYEQIDDSTYDNANDRIMACYQPTSSMIDKDLTLLVDGVDYQGVKVQGVAFDTNATPIVDSVLASGYTTGVTPDTILTDGGSYYDRYHNHAPEELMAGVTYDSMHMTVTTKFASNTKVVSYSIVHNMNCNAASSNTEVWPKYYRVDESHITELAQDLLITDANIYLTDVTKLSQPNPSTNQPGVVYINGEKITYYTMDIVNNSIGQLRRAVDGTGGAPIHAAGSSVVEVNLAEQLPGGANVHLSTWLNEATMGGQYVVDNADNNIVDTFSSNIVTANVAAQAVTDGTGLEGSNTAQAKFIRGELF